MNDSIRTFPGETRLHLGLPVRDVAAAVDFYRRLFATEPSRQLPDYARFDVPDPSLNLSLILGTPAPASTALHFGVEVRRADRYAAMVRTLERVGLDLEVEDSVTCCYALQRKVWARDPDGHPWEFFLVLAETERRGHAAATRDAVDCCVPDAAADSPAARAVDPAAERRTDRAARPGPNRDESCHDTAKCCARATGALDAADH